MPGRPRSSEASGRILRATVELLAEGGTAGVSVDAVAARAGVSRPTVYRRWKDRTELIAARFGMPSPRPTPKPLTPPIRWRTSSPCCPTRLGFSPAHPWGGSSPDWSASCPDRRSSPPLCAEDACPGHDGTPAGGSGRRAGLCVRCRIKSEATAGSAVTR
ncbi:helix-turn-helix domain containing protein [Streptomyces sp. HNM0663]|uniref:Helix-turn-helix domain containing protein n=1 Tax=Streptomyces chengmaiensis TaxID=3040919 RepID=A0ABT6HQI9_9ACTN|nr:helix-turn-helix domain containing protein [Streptomyces chengmaiensis]MDH2390610.1 helix-turn-helix domain containing protein [Streptomyces chengmaiensis]